MLRYLQAAGWLVIVTWGIRYASELISIILIALLLAYGFVPLPLWLMRRFRLGTAGALAATVALLGSLNLFVVFLSYERLLRIKANLPLYHARFMALYANIEAFLNARGIDLASLPASKLATAEGFIAAARPYYPLAESALIDGLSISLLAWIFMIEMVVQPGSRKSYLGEILETYGGDVQRYIAISVKTGLITTLANLVVFLALGVDLPGLWCILYFFLHFIPNIGFLFALVPPVLMALLMSGWQKALLVLVGLIITQTLSDYVLTPILMKKEVHISFLEITVSLMFWGFALGAAGAILAIPLHLVIRRLLGQYWQNGPTAGAHPG